MRMGVAPPVVALCQQLLQQDVEHDEEVAAALLFEMQCGDAVAAAAPADGDYLVAVAAHDRLERQLDGEVKVGREQRLAPLEHAGAVALESVGDVVVVEAKEQLRSEEHTS